MSKTESDLGATLRKIAAYGDPRLFQVSSKTPGGRTGFLQWALEIDIPAKTYEKCGRPHWYFDAAQPRDDRPQGWSNSGWRIKEIADSPETAAARALERLVMLAQGPLGQYADFPESGN